MNKRKLIFLLIPLLLTSCGGTSGNNTDNSQSNPGGSSGGEPTSIQPVENEDEYDTWLNSWSKPDHLYFHYNRGDKGGYDNYCLWIWQHSPQDLEGSLWAFSSNPKVSDKLTLSPMSTHWMTSKEVGKEGDTTYADTYGVIADVDLKAANLVGGKTGTPTTFEGMEEIGFLLPQQNSMSGLTNWVSDGGRETYLDDISEAKNWRDVEGGKAIHIFVSTGALYDYSYYAGSGVAQAVTNPIDEDTTGNYRSDVDAKYSNALGVSSTSDAFKSLGAGYQIFVASFRDSNGDGIGDLRGIIDSLDYLEGLGVQVLWLTPIQKSDSYHGYDISDYYAVDKRFGTVEDYRELLYKAHERGMKVLMDLVLNHTSKGNIWFSNSQWGKVDSVNNINWRDIYNWKYVYYQGKVIGGIYDNRFLVKKTKTAEKLMPDAPSELPYEGGKEMLLVDVDDTDLLNRLIPAVAGDLPAPKKKKRSGICFCLSGNPRTSGYSGDPDFLFFRNFPVYHICFSSFRPRMR